MSPTLTAVTIPRTGEGWFAWRDTAPGHGSIFICSVVSVLKPDVGQHLRGAAQPNESVAMRNERHDDGPTQPVHIRVPMTLRANSTRGTAGRVSESAWRSVR